MTSPFKTKQFNDLKAKWYKKLEKSGFEDAEVSEQHLKEWDSTIGSRYDPAISLDKMQYFQLATQFLHEYDFPEKHQKTIWEMHSDGKSITEISKEMRRRRVKGNYCRSGVHGKIKVIFKEMVKKYKING